MNIFFEIHRDIPREGPGNNEIWGISFFMQYRISIAYFNFGVSTVTGVNFFVLMRLKKRNRFSSPVPHSISFLSKNLTISM